MYYRRCGKGYEVRGLRCEKNQKIPPLKGARGMWKMKG